MKLTYCFDLDGTLARTDGENYAEAEPIPERIERVRRLKRRGHRIVIDTARGSGSGRDLYDLTRQQLVDWRVPFDVLRVGVKTPADVYVDDRAENADRWFA